MNKLEEIKQEGLRDEERCKEREGLTLASDKELKCKNCGSSLFLTFENKAYTNKKDMFMTVDACANCGLIAYTSNMKGWSEKKDNNAPIIKKFLVISKTRADEQKKMIDSTIYLKGLLKRTDDRARTDTIKEVFNEIDKYRQSDPNCKCKTCRFYKKLKQKYRGDEEWDLKLK